MFPHFHQQFLVIPDALQTNGLSTVSFSVEDIRKIIQNLDLKIAHRHDNTIIHLLKVCYDSICKLLEVIFSKASFPGVFPLNEKHCTHLGVCQITCLKRLCPLRAFAPSSLTCLCALRAFALYVPFLRALRSLIVCLKFFLGQIRSPVETFHFPGPTKGTINCAVFMWNSRETF